jgi:hypothetical protein
MFGTGAFVGAPGTNLVVSSPASVLWTPDDIGAYVWDADDAPGEEGDPVGTWSTRYGTLTATASGASRPTKRIALEGLSALSTDGVDDQMLFPALAHAPNQLLVVAVGRRKASSVFTPCGSANSGAAQLRWAPIGEGSVQVADVCHTGPQPWSGFIRQGNANAAANQWCVAVSHGSTATTSHIRRNGTTIQWWGNLGGYNGVGYGNVGAIGARGSSEFSAMDIAWLGIYIGPITDDIIWRMEGFAANAKGITLAADHPYKDSPPYKSTAFSPDDLPNLALWLDASDASTLTLNGSNVNGWRDKSDNGYNFAGSGSARPTWAANKITFDGVDDRLTLGANGIGRNVGGMTVYAVMKWNTTTPPAGSLWLHVANGTGLTTGRTVHYSGEKYSVGGRRLDSDSFVGIDGAYLTTSTRLISQVFDYTNSDLFQYLDGALDVSTTSFQAAGNTSDTDSLGAAIGSRADGASSWANCSVQAILIYHEAHDATKRAQVEAYLTEHYNFDFSPDDLPNLALWLDASDASTLTLSGSNVDEWRDKSGNLRHFTGSGSARPTLVNSSVNGLPGVVGDGVDDRMTSPYSDGLKTNSVIIFVAVKSSESGDYDGSPIGLEPWPLSSHFGQSIDVSWYQAYHSPRYNLGDVRSLYTLGVAFIAEIKKTATTLAGYFDGALVGSVAATHDTPTSYNLFSSFYRFSGIICEVIELDNPSESDVDKVRTYLKAKWNHDLHTYHHPGSHSRFRERDYCQQSCIS